MIVVIALQTMINGCIGVCRNADRTTASVRDIGRARAEVCAVEMPRAVPTVRARQTVYFGLKKWFTRPADIHRVENSPYRAGHMM
mgnify:CR=1 FL=1|jgi:hypothetical protein